MHPEIEGEAVGDPQRSVGTPRRQPTILLDRGINGYRCPIAGADRQRLGGLRLWELWLDPDRDDYGEFRQLYSS